QRRFTYGGGDDGSRWSVPLVVGTRTDHGEARAVELLEGDEATLEIGPEPMPWVDANLEAHGFYRVRYAPDLLDALLAHLDDLTPLERYALVDDLWAFVLAGSVEAATFVDVAQRFGGERDLSVWERIVAGFAQLDALLEGDARAALHTRVAALVGPVRAALGADAARDRAAELLDRYLAHPPSVDPALASPAIAVAATLGDLRTHERLVAHYRAADNPQDRQRTLMSLARFRDPAAFQRTLELALS